MSYRRFHRKEHPDCRSVKFQQVTDDVYACPCGVKFTYSTSTSSGYHQYKPAVKGSCVGCPAAKGAKDRVFRVSVHQDIYERMRKQRLSMRGKVLRRYVHRRLSEVSPKAKNSTVFVSHDTVESSRRSFDKGCQI